MRVAIILPGTCIFLGIIPVLADADPPAPKAIEWRIADDPTGLREMLAAVQSTQAAMHKQGEMVAEFQSRLFPRESNGTFGISPSVDESGTISVSWNLRQRVYKIAFHQVSPSLDVDTRQNITVIQSVDKDITIHPLPGNAGAHMNVSGSAAGGRHPIFSMVKCTPEQLWFDAILSGRKIVNYMLPGQEHSPPAETLVRQSGTLVKIEHHYGTMNDGRYGAVLWTTCDLSCGGNVIEHGFDSVATAGIRTKEFQWAEDPPGVWRLATYTVDCRPASSLNPWHHATLKVLSYDQSGSEMPDESSIRELVEKYGVRKIIDESRGVPIVRRTRDTLVGEDALLELGTLLRASGFSKTDGK